MTPKAWDVDQSFFYLYGLAYKPSRKKPLSYVDWSTTNGFLKNINI